MRNVERAAVGHVKAKRAERSCAVGGAQLLDRHRIGLDGLARRNDLPINDTTTDARPKTALRAFLDGYITVK